MPSNTSPAAHAKISVQTCDETGQPVSAVVGITATDDSVLEMIDKREQTPRLPVMVLLEGEVKELADAQVYLDPANERGPTAVDLLLGTQGWRRFAFVEPAKFAAAQWRQGPPRAGAQEARASNLPGLNGLRRGLWPATPRNAPWSPGKAAPPSASPPPASKPAAPKPEEVRAEPAKKQANADAEAPADIQLGKRPKDLAAGDIQEAKAKDRRAGRSRRVGW